MRMQIRRHGPPAAAKREQGDFRLLLSALHVFSLRDAASLIPVYRNDGVSIIVDDDNQSMLPHASTNEFMLPHASRQHLRCRVSDSSNSAKSRVPPLQEQPWTGLCSLPRNLISSSRARGFLRWDFPRRFVTLNY
jgi:hypothetical protein